MEESDKLYASVTTSGKWAADARRIVGWVDITTGLAALQKR